MTTGLLIGNLSTVELLLIVFVIILLFGATKLPQLGKSLGEGIKNFKQGIKDAESDSSNPAESKK